MATQLKQHFPSIDLLRGLAALTVAFYHYSNFFLPETNPLNFLFARGYLSVQSFFVISGVVVPYSLAQKNYSIRQIGSLFVGRAIRIEVAYWASIALVLFLDACAWYQNIWQWPGMKLYDVFLHFFHLNGIMHQPWLRAIYWTLAIDWQFYIFALLVFPLLNRREWWIRYAFYALFACRFWAQPLYVWLPYHLSAFGAGVMLFHYYQGFMGKKELAIALMVGLGIHHYQIDWELCAATVLPCAIILFVNKEWSWAKFLGKTSYSFYLTHISTGWMLLNGVVRYCGKDNEWLMSVVIFVAVAFSLFFANYFYKWVEVPTLKWGKSWQKWVNGF